MLKSNQCSKCMGKISYDPSVDALKCANCGATYPIDASKDIKTHDYMNDKAKYNAPLSKEVITTRCKNCGAQVLINNFSILDKCSYCGSTNIENIGTQNQIIPDCIVPFAYNQEQAKSQFAVAFKKKAFLPSILKKQTPDLAITPRYVSSYLLSGNVVITYSGTLEYVEVTYDKENRREVHTHYKNVNGVYNEAFDNYTVEGSRNLEQREVRAILPFDFKDLKPYSPEYLFNTSAEYTDRAIDTAWVIFEDNLKRSTENRIVRENNCDSVVNMTFNLQYTEKKFKYCLLPTYIFDYQYKQKHYKNIMNGQTGKLGGGVPRSAGKITAFVLFILAILGAIGLLVYFCG